MLEAMPGKAIDGHGQYKTYVPTIEEFRATRAAERQAWRDSFPKCVPLEPFEAAARAVGRRTQSPEVLAAEAILHGRVPVVFTGYDGGGGIVAVRCPYCGQRHEHGAGDPPRSPIFGERDATCGRGRYRVQPNPRGPRR
ncbi:MAG: hypothetical protein JWQ81_1692 [Amycolatopsis sp.]|jgi:hypothetical protein|nr:hypothetical protein [Amycolatopsis sp.]